MKGQIIQYRRGRKTQYKYQMVIGVDGVVDKLKAEELLGKKVVYTSPSGKKINGEITRLHGSKGRVIARFERGLPGQAIKSEVDFV